jgi:hypothetical protein
MNNPENRCKMRKLELAYNINDANPAIHVNRERKVIGLLILGIVITMISRVNLDLI